MFRKLPNRFEVCRKNGNVNTFCLVRYITIVVLILIPSEKLEDFFLYFWDSHFVGFASAMASRAADDVEPKFEKVLEGLQGAEGPVFDKNGNFFMVAPDTGEIYNVNLQEKRVCKF